MDVTKDKLIDRILFFLISLFVIYVFWFQYTFRPINGVLSILGVLMLILSILKKININSYRYLLSIFIFAALMGISSLLFSENVVISMSLFGDVIKYFLPMIAIYNYVSDEQLRIRKIFVVMNITVTIMAITLFLKGVPSSNGAIVLGELNSNKFSCYLLLGLIAALYLLSENNKKLVKILLIMSVVIIGYAQVISASRRGVAVYMFLILAFFHTIFFVKYKNKTVYKITGVVLGLIVMAVLLYNLLDNVDNIVVLQRFLQHNSVADQARTRYQREAWNIFKNSPFWGMGLGAVALRTGMYSHSMYYELLASGGVFGSMFVLFPMLRKIAHYWSLSNIQMKVSFQMQLRILSWSLIGIMISGIAVVYIYDIDFYIIHGLFAAYSRVLDSKEMGEHLQIVLKC